MGNYKRNQKKLKLLQGHSWTPSDLNTLQPTPEELVVELEKEGPDVRVGVNQFPSLIYDPHGSR